MSDMPGGPRSLIRLGGCEVSRFIVGHNPPCGNSHFSDELNAEMAEYFTADNVLKLYHRAEALGVRTFLIRGDDRMLGWLELYRRAGGAMNVIAQTASEMHDLFSNIRVLAAAGAAAVYHHGTQTDRFWREGRIDDCLDYLQCMRDSGVAVGLATHIPDVIDYAQRHAWDVDFYMACLYNLSRTERESAIVSGQTHRYAHELYLPENRRKMLSTVRSTAKPVLAFKVLAAGRLCQTQEAVAEAFLDAYSHIKPTDGVIVGLFPKHVDQVELDLAHAEAACRAARAASTSAAP